MKTQWTLYTFGRKQNNRNNTTLIPEELFQIEFPFAGYYSIP